MEHFITKSILRSIPRRHFDCVHIECGELIEPSLVRALKHRFGAVINYSIDDPFGPRDGRRWRLFLRAVPFYDLVVVVRECNVREAFAHGAQDVLRVFMSADEVMHAPRPINLSDWKRFSSEVLFIGTWMPERGPFVSRLLALGVPLSIYGDRWHKAKEWPLIRSAWRGPGLHNEDDYARAIQCAKVNLGLLSQGNRDLTTTRSIEIPNLGGLLCAQRTTEHLQLYEEDRDAVFWTGADECARKCAELLNDEEKRNFIAGNGRRRCLQNGHLNQQELTRIFDRAFLKSSRDLRYFGKLGTESVAI